MIQFRSQQRMTEERPAVNMTSMIDIMFINLLFFMALFVYFQFESELSITVPAADQSKAGVRTGEIIVNVMKDGSVVVHRKKMGLPELEHLLRRSSELYPEQEVVLRADRKAYHEQVVTVLDVCARAKIWNISFAATQDGQ